MELIVDIHRGHHLRIDGDVDEARRRRAIHNFACCCCRVAAVTVILDSVFHYLGFDERGGACENTSTAPRLQSGSPLTASDAFFSRNPMITKGIPIVKNVTTTHFGVRIGCHAFKRCW